MAVLARRRAAAISVRMHRADSSSVDDLLLDVSLTGYVSRALFLVYGTNFPGCFRPYRLACGEGKGKWLGLEVCSGPRALTTRRRISWNRTRRVLVRWCRCLMEASVPGKGALAR